MNKKLIIIEQILNLWEEEQNKILTLIDTFNSEDYELAKEQFWDITKYKLFSICNADEIYKYIEFAFLSKEFTQIEFNKRFWNKWNHWACLHSMWNVLNEEKKNKVLKYVWLI